MFLKIEAPVENILKSETPEVFKLLCEKEKHTVTSVTPDILKLTGKYSDVFTGMGKMKDVTISLHIDKNVKPVAQKHRRIPFHMRSKVESELQRLEKLDIIEKVDSSATDWISPIVMVPKPTSPAIKTHNSNNRGNASRL